MNNVEGHISTLFSLKCMKKISKLPKNMFNKKPIYNIYNKKHSVKKISRMLYWVYDYICMKTEINIW